MILPDRACQVKDGMASVRGAGLAQFEGADLSGARLIATHLNQAELTGVKLGGAAIERVLANAARKPPAELDEGTQL